MVRNALKQKALFLMMLGLMPFISVLGQDLKKAITLTENEQFGPAWKAYESLIKQQPDNGEVYFYYGESYLKSYFTDTANVDLKEVTALAKTQFEKGTSVAPGNPLNFVGLGKAALYSGNKTEADAQFQKALLMLPTGKQNKTMNMPVELQVITLQKIADAYLKASAKDTGNVFPYLRRAEKLDKKNPETFLIRGDGYLFIINDGSNAIVNYKRAQELDPKSSKAKLRLGQLWVRAKRYQDALGYYKEALDIDSTFTPAYRELAELYAMAGQYENAKINYKKFLELSGQNTYAKVRYASFLFLTKDYQDAINQINEILSQDQSYNFLYRLSAYSLYETNQADKALTTIEKFFKGTKPDKILQSDYVYYGKIYAKLGQDSIALIQYKKAQDMDSTNMDLLQDMVTSNNKLKKYDKSAELYEMKIRMGKAGLQDYHAMGKAYYSTQNWVKADSAFAYVIRQKPDFIPAYLWLARVYSNLDPETKDGLAKPYYEKLAEVAMADSVKNSKELVEAYSYLAYYYLKVKKFCESIDYWQKVLAIDPKNEKATDAIKGLKGRCPGR